MDNDRPTLITGGCGFIGTNLAVTLASAGRPVLVLDDMSRDGSELNKSWMRERHGNRITFVNADVATDEDAIRECVSDAGAVLHLAGQVAVTTSLEDPNRDFEVNARGTLNVLEAVRKHNPEAPIIFASTNKVYGDLDIDLQQNFERQRWEPTEESLLVGIGEAQPLDLCSPYGCSKGAADQYVRDYHRVFGLKTAVMRMSCIYGNRQFGTEDQGWVAHFLRKARRGEPITIFGDGYQVRDILFISDAVAAWLGALDHIDKAQGRIFNLGGGYKQTVSLLSLVGHIEDLLGTRPDIRFDQWREGDQKWYVSDIRALRQTIGWQPTVPVDLGLRNLDQWLSELEGVPA
jgi:CDP-paratose 2-epimerase